MIAVGGRDGDAGDLLRALHRTGRARTAGEMSNDFLREIVLNGSIVALLGAFAVGCITGERSMTSLKPFLLDAFAGFLCIFLLDMGLIAGRGFGTAGDHCPSRSPRLPG